MRYPEIDVINFRELGGIKTEDGRTIREGFLFRSGQPHDKIDEKSAARIEALHLDTIFDMRDESTVANRPDYPFKGPKMVRVPVLELMRDSAKEKPIDFAAIDVSLIGDKRSCKELKKLYNDYLRIYQEIPFSKGFKQIFDALSRHERILIHCQGGKDRTGLACIFILKALGVDDKTVFADYKYSNKVRKKKNHWRLKKVWKQSHQLHNVYYIRKLLMCTKKNYQTTMKAIYKEYPTFDAFLLGEFGIDQSTIQDWKNFYLN